MLIGSYILILSAIGILFLTSRYAASVFLVCALFIPSTVGFEISGINLFTIRVLVFAGLIHLSFRRKLMPVAWLLSDKIMVMFAAVYIFSGFFHKDVSQALVFRLGRCIDYLGTYYLFRCWLRDWNDLLPLSKTWFCSIVALSCFLAIEQATGRNIFSIVGRLPEFSGIRAGRLRASGPFRHPILCGTAGAVFVPFAITLWKQRGISLIGIIAGCAVVFFSASSGPVGSLIAGLFGVSLWRFRNNLRLIIWSSITVLLCLHFFIMKAPVWYLMARFTVVGGSTGYHRARLIDNAIAHLGEWWFAGTDYTRHWMATGISWSSDHTDITNFYLGMGVIGGLPLMMTFIAVIWACFRLLGRTIKSSLITSEQYGFLFWCLGAIIFSHVVTMLSVGYYDQSGALFFAMVATIVTACSIYGKELKPCEE